jgi:serine carboxypeptidase 1
VKDAIGKGKFKDATKIWDETEAIMSKYTNGVNVYNILQTDTTPLSYSDGHKESHTDSAFVPGSKDIGDVFDDLITSHLPVSMKEKEAVKYQTVEGTKLLDVMQKIGAKHLRKFHSKSLSEVMNGPVKQMLRIIPQNVTWGGQSNKVFAALGEDFMKPVVYVVENLLNNTSVAVNVYSGQLDLIVDTMGTLKWVESMSWSGIQGWSKAKRQSIVINNSTEMFVTTFKNFGFYWVLKAGHMVPADAPMTALEMLKLITTSKR